MLVRFGDLNGVHAVVSHLLDRGYSANHLHKWWVRKLRHEPGAKSLADILDDAQALATTPHQRFRVLAPLKTGIGKPGQRPFEWMNGQDAALWFQNNGSDAKRVRQHGAIEIEVEALDAETAVQSATEVLDRVSRRVRARVTRNSYRTPPRTAYCCSGSNGRSGATPAVGPVHRLTANSTVLIARREVKGKLVLTT